MITIDNLSFKYGKKEVLNDISMELEAGKLYGLLGENGVGKTTLLKIISGLQNPGKDPVLFSAKIRLKGHLPF